MSSILIVDDEPTVRAALTHHFADRGWHVSGAGSGAEGIAAAEAQGPDIILLDMRLPDMTGLEALRALGRAGSGASVVIMTAWGTIENAVEAIQQGAEQYFTKPLSLDELDAVLARIVEKRKLRLENEYYRQRLDHSIVGVSRDIHNLHHLIELMAENASTTVLITGESGTGKELVAREIHRKSPRGERPLLDINCAAISEHLAESEIFGHERGAFTDARTMKRGLLEVADGGTVFLDEIGELPLAIQPKLLRVLETRSFKRVGGTREIRVDLRIIAATNRDLSLGVREGWFREDLYYRLSVFPVALPPLRERREDVPVLAGRFLQEFNSALGKSLSGFTQEAAEALAGYVWPGNVRELRNIVERCVVLCPGGAIGADLLPPEISGRRSTPGPGDGGQGEALTTLEAVERGHIARILAAEQGNRTHAARVLGISRSTLHEKMKRFGLQ